MLMFKEIHQIALKRKGGSAALADLMPKVRSTRALSGITDDRFLAQMSRCVFQAGFVWRVVDHKWDGFEEVFFGFPPERIVMLSPDQIDRFAKDARIIRNRQKVLSVQANAHYLLEVAREHGNFGRFITRWPSDNLVGLFAHMKKHGSRLGGMTGQRVLRNMGRDTFVLTGDVVRALRRAGADISDSPSSQRELRIVQDIFNTWHEESGLPYSHLSRILACSHE
ncbi:3-methyladenine DNA glycosylase [Kineobactrum sediminis]|uniref:3-methyladenine DNA glycosylase n=1 Tax=Kineobactrum sediminis TaxID=1905677 RepID=A0A2N5XZ06_9GAMM|nr:DNA-3-methyladenine glycosylase I [Kineobactrum sediminis]PLW81381.1 3-methyladenine DNA glycosylase [Kineobactrum sediminis]